MKEYHVIKKYVDIDEEEGFYIENIKDPNKKDITSKIDTEVRFEDDDELIEYLAQVFNEDPDEIDINEIETTVEYTGSTDLDPENT